MSERVDDIHFNMPEEDVTFLYCVLKDYKGIFKKECETYKRCEKIEKVLEIAIHRCFMHPKKIKEEQ